MFVAFDGFKWFYLVWQLQNVYMHSLLIGEDGGGSFSKHSFIIYKI